MKSCVGASRSKGWRFTGAASRAFLKSFSSDLRFVYNFIIIAGYTVGGKGRPVNRDKKGGKAASRDDRQTF
jgi:hypothetical protein